MCYCKKYFDISDFVSDVQKRSAESAAENEGKVPSDDKRDKAIKDMLQYLEALKYKSGIINLQRLKVQLDYLMSTYHWRANDWFHHNMDLYNKIVQVKSPESFRSSLIQVIGPLRADNQAMLTTPKPVDQQELAIKELLMQLESYREGVRQVDERNMERLKIELYGMRKLFNWSATEWFRNNIPVYNEIMKSPIDEKLKQEIVDVIALARKCKY